MVLMHTFFVVYDVVAYTVVAYDVVACRLKKLNKKELGFYAAGTRWTTLVL
jgi:hypothetical protein